MISTMYAPPSTYQGVPEQKINIRFFGNIHDLLTPTTYHLHISHMAARFDFDSKAASKTIRQVPSAHPCIAIDLCKK